MYVEWSMRQFPYFLSSSLILSFTLHEEPWTVSDIWNLFQQAMARHAVVFPTEFSQRHFPEHAYPFTVLDISRVTQSCYEAKQDTWMSIVGSFVVSITFMFLYKQEISLKRDTPWLIRLGTIHNCSQTCVFHWALLFIFGFANVYLTATDRILWHIFHIERYFCFDLLH